MSGWEKKASALSRAERLALLDRDEGTLPLSTQARLLGLNRSGLYYKPAAEPTEDELEIKRRIDEIYTRWPFYGSRRITAELQRGGWVVNRKAVQRHMREMGISGICPGPNLSRRRHDHRVYPYLLRGLSITVPDQVWGIDVTYIRLRRTWMYLAALIDWYSRYVVEWELGDTLEEEIVLEPVRRAFAKARPDILNSDQGSQFTGAAYVDLVTGSGVRISMDGRGRALDNIFIERLWRSLKYEEVYLHEYDTPREARASIGTYLAFYNQRRVHQTPDYRTPAEVYAERTTSDRAPLGDA